MRIWKIDGKEQTEVPKGILIARDMKATPSAPIDFPHKVEYLDTDELSNGWILVCNGRRNFSHELADRIHGKMCHYSHEDQCSYHYHKWGDISPNSPRQKYLDKANSVLSAILAQNRNVSEDAVFTTACIVSDAL